MHRLSKRLGFFPAALLYVARPAAAFHGDFMFKIVCDAAQTDHLSKSVLQDPTITILISSLASVS
jgi:hypothetical protein